MDANSRETGGILDCACNSRPDPLEARVGADAGALGLRPDFRLDAGAPGCQASGAHDLSRQSSVRQGDTAVRINLPEGIPPTINL